MIVVQDDGHPDRPYKGIRNAYPTNGKSRHDLKAEFNEECDKNTLISLAYPKCSIELAVLLLIGAGLRENRVQTELNGLPDLSYVTSTLPNITFIRYLVGHHEKSLKKVVEWLSNFPQYLPMMELICPGTVVNTDRLEIPRGLYGFRANWHIQTNVDILELIRKVDKAGVRFFRFKPSYGPMEHTADGWMQQCPHIIEYRIGEIGQLRKGPTKARILMLFLYLDFKLDLARHFVGFYWSRK